jgi:hypothetical protein
MRETFSYLTVGYSDSGSAARISFPGLLFLGPVELRSVCHPHRCASVPDSNRVPRAVSASNIQEPTATGLASLSSRAPR